MLETKEDAPVQEAAAQEKPAEVTAKKSLHADGSSGYDHRVFISHRGTQKAEAAFPIMAIFSYFCGHQFSAFDEVTLELGDSNHGGTVKKSIKQSADFIGRDSEKSEQVSSARSKTSKK